MTSNDRVRMDIPPTEQPIAPRARYFTSQQCQQAMCSSQQAICFSNVTDAPRSNGQRSWVLVMSTQFRFHTSLLRAFHASWLEVNSRFIASNKEMENSLHQCLSYTYSYTKHAMLPLLAVACSKRCFRQLLASRFIHFER